MIKGLGYSEEERTYSIRNDTILVQVDTITVKLIRLDDYLLAVDLDSGWQYNQFVFERLAPEPNELLVVPDFKRHPYWIVYADSSSINYGLELLMLDSATLVISQFFEEDAILHLENTRQTVTKIACIYTFQIGIRWMIRLFDWKNSSFQGQCYEFHFADGAPIKQNFVFENSPLPSKKFLKSMKKNLIGSWILNAGGIPFEPEFSDYDRIENEFFILSFSKNDFEIRYGAEFINQDKQDLLSEKIIGTWKLGLTGKYIELELSNGHIKYLTIAEMKEGRLSINLRLKTPDSESIYSSNRIKLERN